MTDYRDADTPALESLREMVAGAALADVERILAERALSDRGPKIVGEPGVSEKQVQRRIYNRLKELGAVVYWMSQPRESGISVGVPDLLFFLPGDPWRMGWIEVKADGGRQSVAQRRFQVRCDLAGITCLVGGMAEVEAYLKGER
jgi:hypothetical protein